MKNTCFVEEGCSFPSSSNELKVLLKQLKREIKTIAMNHEKDFLKHDGKIAEMCKYIKENLSNSIRCMLDSMQLSGELDHIITDTILNEFNNLKNDSINIKDFGAIGNGKADNTTAFIQAFNLANKLKKNIYIPSGKYVINNDLPILYSGVEIYGDSYTNRIDHGSIIIDKRSSSNYLIRIEELEGETLVGGGIKNISFIYEGKSELAHCISIGKSAGWVGVYENVKVYGYPGTAIKSLANDHRFMNCSISSCSSKDNYAVYLTGTCNENKFIGCHIEHCRYVMKVDGQAFLNQFSNGKIEMSMENMSYTELEPPILITSTHDSTPMAFYNSTFVNLDIISYSNENNPEFSYNSVPAMIDSSAVSLIINGCTFTVGGGSSNFTSSQRLQGRFIKAMYGVVTNNEFIYPSHKVPSIQVYIGTVSNNNFLASDRGTFKCKGSAVEGIIKNDDCLVKSVGNCFYGRYVTPYTVNNEDYLINATGKFYGGVYRAKPEDNYVTLVIKKNFETAELHTILDIGLYYLGTDHSRGRFTLETFHTNEHGQRLEIKNVDNMKLSETNTIHVFLKDGNYYIQFKPSSTNGLVVDVKGIKGNYYTSYIDSEITELITDYDRTITITNG